MNDNILPIKIVVLTFPNNHSYRHDFYKDVIFGESKVDEFVKAFEDLNTFLSEKIKIEVFNSFKELPEEYKKEQPANYY
jgi:hypothetical protein